MRKCFLLVGDYHSALVCSRNVCPITPAPMDPKWVCAYGDYYSLPASTVLKHHSTQVVLKDRKNRPLKAIGTWHCPNNLFKLQSAVAALHNLYSHLHKNIAYDEKCDECV
jgi:hypothetical protein